MAVDVTEAPAGTRIYDHRWVDTDDKSRLTCKDLKRYSKEAEIEVQCPTSLAYINNCFDYYIVVFDFEMLLFNSVRAVLHAAEQHNNCYMHAPQDWHDKMRPKAANKVWRITQSLYGRRTAGAQIRDLFKAVVCLVPGLTFKRGLHEPCAFHGPETEFWRFITSMTGESLGQRRT